MISHVKRQDWINVAGALIAVGLIALLFYCTHALITQEVPAPNKDALMVVIGILSMNVAQVVSWFFGSSAENKRLAEANANQAETIKTAQAALTPNLDATVTLGPGESATVAASGESEKV